MHRISLVFLFVASNCYATNCGTFSSVATVPYTVVETHSNNRAINNYVRSKKQIVNHGIRKRTILDIPSFIQYNLGETVRQEALLEKQSLKLNERFELERLRGMQQTLELLSNNGNFAAGAKELIQPTDIISVKCGKCHNNDTPKGGFLLGPGFLTDEQAKKVKIRAVDEGADMPPDNPLTQEEKFEMLSHLVDNTITQ